MAAQNDSHGFEWVPSCRDSQKETEILLMLFILSLLFSVSSKLPKSTSCGFYNGQGNIFTISVVTSIYDIQALRYSEGTHQHEIVFFLE